MPCSEAEISVTVKGHPICVRYKNSGSAKRSFRIDSKEARGEFCKLMNTEKLRIPAEDIHDGMVIEVID